LEFGVLKVRDSEQVLVEADLTGFQNLSGLSPECHQHGQYCNLGFQPRAIENKKVRYGNIT
jgi:hypothetical protein